MVANDNPNDGVERPVPRYAVLIMATAFVVTVFLVTGRLAYVLKLQSAHRHGVATDSIGVYIPVALVALYTGLGIIMLLTTLLAERLADMWHQAGNSLELLDGLERRLLACVCSGWRVVVYLIIGVPTGAFLWWLLILL